jgi:hypothetical protein
MRVAHFDCFSGISGDMTLAALVDCGVDLDAIIRAVASLDLPVRIIAERVTRCGIAATHIRVDHDEQSSHRYLPEIVAMLGRGSLTTPQRELALRIFRNLAEAEATVHGIPVDQVHFHEVGALDSITDIVGTAVGMCLLGVDRVTSRAVPTGSGMVKCAHGNMPVPAPATAHLLRGVPIAPSPIKMELTTPTGAAILTTLANEFTDSPVMTIDRIGHGAGTADLATQPNVLRLFVGSTAAAGPSPERDTVWMLETNLDDVPGEIVGYCFERLFEAGALDVFTMPIQMKKNRPGVMLSVLAPAERIADLEAILFRETATFGVRRFPVERSKLQRESVTVATPWGPIRAKRGLRAGLEIVTPEFDDCARVAREQNRPLREVFEIVRRAAEAGRP